MMPFDRCRKNRLNTTLLVWQKNIWQWINSMWNFWWYVDVDWFFFIQRMWQWNMMTPKVWIEKKTIDTWMRCIREYTRIAQWISSVKKKKFQHFLVLLKTWFDLVEDRNWKEFLIWRLSFSVSSNYFQIFFLGPFRHSNNILSLLFPHWKTFYCISDSQIYLLSLVSFHKPNQFIQSDRHLCAIDHGNLGSNCRP